MKAKILFIVTLALLLVITGCTDKDKKSYWVPHATFQMARCHFLLSEYDEALATIEKFIEGKPGLLWEARAKVHLSSLFHALPTYGYERNDKVYYNYEHHEGEYRYMYDENRDIARTLGIGWDLLTMIPRNEIKRIKDEFIERYLPSEKKGKEDPGASAGDSG